MIRRLVEHEDRPASAHEEHNDAPARDDDDRPSPEDVISAWLSTFGRLVHMPAARAEDTLRELESHLRERVRDLLLKRYNEHDAVHQAVRELGDAAHLARRFTDITRTRRRRQFMKGFIFGSCAVVLATTAMIAFTSSETNVPMSVYAPTVVQDESAALDRAMLKVTFNDEPLAAVFEQIAGAVGADLYVHWDEIGFGASPDSPVTLQFDRHDRAASTIMTFVSDQFEGAIAWRLRDDLLEIATHEYFDRQEAILASFSIDHVIGHLVDHVGDYEAARSSIEDLIYTYVEPYSWEVNGGATARLRIVGGTLFIQAPPRFHEPIQWLLSELGAEDPEAMLRDDKKPVASGELWQPINDESD